MPPPPRYLFASPDRQSAAAAMSATAPACQNATVSAIDTGRTTRCGRTIPPAYQPFASREEKSTMHAALRRGILGAAAAGAVAALAVVESPSARAAGFALREGSADWMANAFAGD